MDLDLGVSCVQSYVETFLPSSENHQQNVPLGIPQMHYGAIFQPTMPETWQKCSYTTLYLWSFP